MAQTSSAAREPSMEEILASIRRIIEDSDVVRQSVPPKPERPNVTPVTPVRGEIAEFRRDPEPVLRPVQPAPREREEERRVQDADEAMNALAARIGLRGTLDARTETAPQPVKPSFAVPDIEEEDEPQLNPGNDDHPLKAAAVAPMKLAAEMKPEPAPVTKPVIPNPAEPAQTVSVAVERTEPAFEEPSAPYVSAAENPPIISPTTVRQVAAAFDDLSLVMRAEQRRSLDEMAEKMLRPMLQEWLDNNLPTLVERLVREEIERVVRGGARA
jgi:uncharacterized protein